MTERSSTPPRKTPKPLNERGKFGKVGGNKKRLESGFSSIFCKECGSRSGVVDTRHSGGYVRRRRQCYKKKHRWTTIELAVPEAGRQGLNPITLIMRKFQEDAMRDLAVRLKQFTKATT